MPSLRDRGSVVATTDASTVGAVTFAQALVVTLAAGRVSYHYDESVTIAAFVRGGWLTPFTREWLHNNHPVFSFLEHLVWRAGGDSELAFRVVPALSFAAAVALLAHWATRHWGVVAGAAAAMVMLTHPMAVEFGRQARGYSLVMFAAIGATLLVPRLLARPRDLPASIGYVALLAAGIGTHLYIGAVVLGHVGYVIASRKLSPGWLLRFPAAVVLGLLTYVGFPRETPLRRGFKASFPADAGRELFGSTWLSIAVLGACTVAFVALHRRVWLMVALPALATIYIWWRMELATIHPRYFMWTIPAIALAVAWVVGRHRWVALPVLVASTAMAVTAWPVTDPGIRDASAVAVGAHARGHEVCAVGLEAMWAYAIRGRELPRSGEQPRCDVLITIGTWRPAGYDELLATLPYRAEFGPVHVAAVEDVHLLFDAEGGSKS